MAESIHPHQQLLNQFRQEFNEIFTKSSQGIYAYMDDPHWICNERMAALFGYGSAQELHAAAGNSFLDTLVAPESQQKVVDHYTKAVNNFVGVSMRVSMKKKNGGTMPVDAIFVPIVFKGTLMALHFLSPA